MRKVLQVLLGILAGFFVYMVDLLVFIKVPGHDGAAVGVALGFCIPAALLLLAACAAGGFATWKTTTGVVLLSATGFTLFAAFTIAMMLASPELVKLYPQLAEIFGNFSFGVAWNLAILALGGLLVIRGRRSGAASAPAPRTPA